MASRGGHRILHAADLGEPRCTYVHYSRTYQCGIGYGALHVQVSQPELSEAAFPKTSSSLTCGREYSVSTLVRTEYVRTQPWNYIFLACFPSQRLKERLLRIVLTLVRIDKCVR